jgi:hypothetical protein
MTLKKKFMLNRSDYKMKPNHKDFETAAKKIQKQLQQDENMRFGKKAQTVSYAYVTKYIYDNFMRGKRI